MYNVLYLPVSLALSWFTVFTVFMILFVVRSVAVIIDGDTTSLDISVCVPVIVVSPVVLPVTIIIITVLDYAAPGVWGDVV